MKAFCLAAFLLATGGMSLAHADDWYVGVGIGSADSSFSNVGSATSTQGVLGYRFKHSPIGLELSYTDFGNMGINSALGGTLRSSGTQLMAVWNFYPERAPGNIYLKAGAYSMDTELKYTPGFWFYSSCPSGDCTQTSTGAVMGVGGDYHVSRDVSIYGEADVYSNVNYIENTGTTSVLLVGARVKF